MKTIFFGGSKHIIPILEFLKNDFNLSLIITTDKLPSDLVISFAAKNNIECVSPIVFNEDLIKKLSKRKADFAVLAYFGLIIPPSLLDSFQKGILNIHPSLLPKYRGPTPVQTAILNKEKVTGVSLIKLDNKIDHGPIIVQKPEAILDNDTAESLYLRLFKTGADLLQTRIKAYLNDNVKLRKQDDSRATFTKRLNRDDGYIKISESPEKIKRMIRAFYPWPGVWLKIKLNGQEKIVKLLPENKIQVEGKGPMSFKDFINGYPNTPGNLKNLIENVS